LVAYNADAVNTIKVTALESLLANEVIEALATTLLHSFKAKAKVDWKGDFVFMVILNNVQPAQDGALVVRAAASDQPACGLVDSECEGFGIPAIGFVCL